MSSVSQMTLNKKIVASSILSFIWVGNYQYHYNIEAFNTQSINIWAFSLWVISGYLYLTIHGRVKNKIENRYLPLVISWFIYLTGLLLIEYIGYAVLGIRENSARGEALILGLIHGNSTLHTYYMLFPALIIAIYQLLLVLPANAIKILNTLRQASGRYTTWP